MATEATRSHDYLVSPTDGIEGSKLPSGKQSLCYFLHLHTVQKENVRLSATHTIQKVEEFWARANIPVKHRHDSIKKLEQLFIQWKGLKKNKSRKTETQQNKEIAFLTKIEELFDIACADAKDLINDEEDKLFLDSQRKKGRPGCMIGIDKVQLQQNKMQKEKQEKLQIRLYRSQLDKDKLLEKAVLKTSSNESEETPCEDKNPIAGTSTSSPPRKRGRKSVLTPTLAAMLDRNKLSDRAATMIVFEASRAFGQEAETLVVNRSSIRRLRRKHREAIATSISESFKPNTALTVHWDGKLMFDITGNKKVNRLPILVSMMGKTKLLEIPKIPTGTGQDEAQAVYNVIRKWGLENLVQGMCFDTTSSNTGRLSGACITLEQLLGRPLLHFACRHHILELVLSAAFGVCIGPSNAPEILVFKRFQDQWSSIDQRSYDDASSDDFASTELGDVRSEIISFCEQQFQEQQPRDDYRELLELVLMFLGAKAHHDKMFRSPGPMHKARWMAKAIYSMKLWMFRSQFKLTARETHGLLRLNVFLAKVYIKFWYQAPLASKAAHNDLKLLQILHAYPDHEISLATTRKIAGQLWYLSEDLILLSLFDPNVDLITKRKMLQASTEKEGKEFSLKRVHFDLPVVNVQSTTLVDFVSKRSRTLFAMLGMPDGFLSEDPQSWSDRDDFKTAEAIVKTQAVTNDHAERGVALIQEAAQSGIFKNEEQLQYALQVIEQNRAMYPDAKKSTLLKKAGHTKLN